MTLKSWQDKFCAKLDEADAALKSARLSYENGEAPFVVEMKLKAARAHIRDASKLASVK